MARRRRLREACRRSLTREAPRRRRAATLLFGSGRCPERHVVARVFHLQRAWIVDACGGGVEGRACLVLARRRRCRQESHLDRVAIDRLRCRLRERVPRRRTRMRIDGPRAHGRMSHPPVRARGPAGIRCAITRTRTFGRDGSRQHRRATSSLLGSTVAALTKPPRRALGLGPSTTRCWRMGLDQARHLERVRTEAIRVAPGRIASLRNACPKSTALVPS